MLGAEKVLEGSNGALHAARVLLGLLRLRWCRSFLFMGGCVPLQELGPVNFPRLKVLINVNLRCHFIRRFVQCLLNKPDLASPLLR